MDLYTDIDPACCVWLRELIAGGHLPPGDVLCKSIVEMNADDVRGYRQVHFFCGIGGWALALAWAGYDGPCWTGSCPCQPFSAAGKRGGVADERHLWPEFYRLIRACNPPAVFGEQVPDDGWMERAALDLQAEGYGVRAAVWDARVFGCPQPRRRYYFAADPRLPGVEGLEPRRGACFAGPWGWCGEADMRAIAESPFVAGDRWPQPLLRAVDDGVSERVGIIKGGGNAIVPQVAAEFVKSYMETLT